MRDEARAGMTGAAAAAAALARLRGAGVPDAAGDARHLLAHALGVDRGRLALVQSEPLDAASAARFNAAVEARCARQPVSQIIGRREFFGREFHVTRDVLDPRPDTETLVETALNASFDRVLDLGTGSGCILLTLLAERPGATGVGVDISPAAIAVARRNALDLGLETRAGLFRSDWFGAVEGYFDLIVSNPPYVAAEEFERLDPEVALWEPRAALTDEGDGLACYRAIAAGAPAHLAPGGRILVEIGPTQARAVSDLFGAAEFANITVHPDLDGRDRVVEARIQVTHS